MNIGYYINARIGDSVVALPSICAIKLIYPQCKLFVWTNSIGVNLFSNIQAIDQVFEISDELIQQINSLSLTYLISSNSDQNTISHLKTSNAKKIITYLKPYNLFDFRIKTAFRSYRIQKNSEKQNLLNLTNLINPNSPLLLSQINNAKLSSSPINQQYIQNLFLHTQAKQTILINPFAYTAKHLDLQDYITIAQNLIENYHIIIPTFDKKRDLLLKHLPSKLLHHQNFSIFHNNSDLLNLVALLEKVNLVISPSTGAIHIADNLGIPSIALFSAKDRNAWGGGNMHYIILDQKPTDYIKQTLELTEQILQSK